MELLILFVCLALAYILSQVFKRLSIPSVLGQIIAGVILGIPVIKAALFTSEELKTISVLADIGLIFLLFFVGLKIDIAKFIKVSGSAISIAFFGAIIPFSLAFIATLLIGYDYLTASIIGICVSITAEAISINILQEMKMLRSKIATIIIESGLIDDGIGIVLISVVITVASTSGFRSTGFALGKVLLEILVFVALVYILRFFILPVIWRFIDKDHDETSEFTAALIVTLFIAMLATIFKLSSVIGAIIAGVVIRQILVGEGRYGIIEERKITKIIETVTFGFLGPFFFIWIGLNTNVSLIWIAPVFGILITVIALSGKLAGSILGNVLTGGSVKEGSKIGWGMNTRGAIELIVAEIARKQGLISMGVFSALVFMALETTIISPIVFKELMKKRKKPKKKKKKK